MARTIRYQAAILLDNQILLIKHGEHQSGRTYWLLPGGGIEVGETEEECVRREAYEETGLDVRVEQLLLDEPTRPDDKAYQRFKTYLCTPLSGKAQPGFEPEEEAAALYAITDVDWVDLCDETKWSEAIKMDPITAPLLRRIRAILCDSE